MNNNLINKTIDWSINAINSDSNSDSKSPNWLFRLIIICLFFFILFLFYIVIE